MAELKQKVLSGLRWSVGARAASQLATWASTIIVMRLLQPSDYGLMAMAAFFIALCMLVNELGMGAAVVQAKEVTDTLLRQVFGVVLIGNGTFFVILTAGSPLIARFFDEPRLVAIVSVLALQFPIAAFSVIPSATLNRKMNFRGRSIAELIAMLSGAIVTLIMAWTGFGVWSLVVGSLVTLAVRTVGFCYIEPFCKRPSFNFANFADRAKFGGYITVTRLLWYFYSQADVFIVGKLLGKTILGYYSVAMHVASLPMQKVGGILQQVALPAYSQLQDNKELASSYVLKASRVLSFFAFPIFFGISSVANEIITVALGEKWLPAILPLQLLSLIIPLRTIQISIGPAVNGMGRPDVNVRNLIAACILMPVSFFIGTYWGLLGVSLAWIIAFSLWFLFMLTGSLPVLGVTMGRFLKTLWLPFMYSSIMYGAVYLIKLLLTRAGTDIIVTLIAMVVTGAVVFAGSMLLFSRPTCRQIWGMLRG
ncbi:MAG: lipopolysaccharide biosynthesis protein [Candidatus Zixiibacteriota bacterium]|nr:MAG: lipopolysaccharide biosynthesis protein [candidate division Zixibacteria bacterium]